jgi:hypothetical protein
MKTDDTSRFAMFAAALLTCSCWGYPLIGVQVEKAGNGIPALSFKKCSAFNFKPLIERVDVRPQGPPPNRKPPLCTLTVADRSDFQPIDRWVYGQPLDKFVSSGACSPLAPGSYEVVARGTGSGSRLIVVADDGEIRAGSPDCNP